MAINGIPNKFEIFQNFYYDENGIEISYQEALKLYSQMDADTKTDFEKYYKDETGYEVISRTGYNFDMSFEVTDSGKTKKVKKKEKQADGSIKYVEKEVKVFNTTKTITLEDGTTKVIENYTPQSVKNAIKSKYAMEAYMKKNGMIIDPQWAGYSAEEILQMENEGVNIPQEVVDAAHSIYESSGANFETGNTDNENAEETTEKEPFLDLIPKAEKKIRKCNENSQKIEEKVEDLLPEKQKKQKNFRKKMEEQRASLKEFEEYVREWRHLQNKINNGEALSDREAMRYAQITGMLEDKNNSENQNIDKKEIARNLNDINILAALGEKLATETVEIGDTLADYTSKANYKSTRREIRGQVGFLAAIMAMARGERLAVEAVKIGNDTKEYTDETQKSVKEIASIMEVESSIASTDNLKTSEEKTQNPQEQKETEAETQSAQTKASDMPTETVENENEENPTAEEETKTSEVSMEEDFIVNDENVLDLVKEASDIISDLTGQSGNALKTLIAANSDIHFAKSANKKIAKIVKEYQEEEARRQQEIDALEAENKESYKKLEELTGKDKNTLEEEITGTENSDKADDETSDYEAENTTSESDKREIEERKTSVQTNNEKIEELNTDKEAQIEDFKARTTKEKTRIQKSVPEENELLKTNSEYAEKIIPEDKERINFTDNSGETLAKMGKYRVLVGMAQLASLQYKKGIKNVRKGTISTSIGLGAMVIARTPAPKIAEKTTEKAVQTGTKAITALNQTDAQISAVTGEETSQESYNNNNTETEESTQTTENNTEAAENTEAATEGTEDKAPAKEETTTETTQATSETVQTNEQTQTSEQQTLVDANVTASVKDMQNAQTAQEEAQKSTEEKSSNKIGETSSSKSNSKPEKEQSAMERGPVLEKENDKAEDKIKKVDSETKDDNKDSEAELKDTQKDKKQLEKEAKQLEKQMKKDQELIIKMTQESMEAAKREAEILTEYQTLTTENEKMMAEDEAANQTQPAPQTNKQGEQGGVLASNSFNMGQAGQANNSDKLMQNGAKITELNSEFKVCDNVIQRNQTKMFSLQKTTKAKEKKYVKKTKTITKQVKESEKKEQEKQKRLAKQLAIVGIQENVFSLTLSTGTIYTLVTAPALLSNPFTVAPGMATLTVGQILMAIGTAGIAACGVSKAIINLANGNLTAALMGLGSTAVSVIGNFVPGVGAASNSVLTAVTTGLNVVSTSAELVNNVRAVQGKEASGVFSKIATIAGTASALTNAAGTIGSLKDTTNSFTKMAKIGSVTGTALSSTSQIMTEFGDSNSKFAQMLGNIGGALSLASSVALLAAPKNEKSEQDDSETKTETENDTKDNKTQETEQKQEEQKTQKQQETEQKQEEQKVQKQQETEQKQEEQKTQQQEKELKKAESKAQKEQQKNELKEAKEAKANQKEKAKNVTNKEQKQNMIESGASEKFADIDDNMLNEKYKYAVEIGDDKLAAELSQEIATRADYKEKMDKLAENKTQKTEKFKNVADIAGKAFETASAYFGSQNTDAQPQKKKGFAANTLSPEAQKRLRRDKRRIAALSSANRNRKYA